MIYQLKIITDNQDNKKDAIIELFNNEHTSNDITKDIREEIENGNLDELIKQLIDNTKEELIIEGNCMKYEITTTQSNINEYKDISIIKLC